MRPLPTPAPSVFLPFSVFPFRSSPPARPFRLALLPLLAALLVLGACASSPPIHWRTLLPPADSSTESGSAEELVDILPISVPQSADRQGIVLTRRDGSLLVFDSERWAAPLPEEFGRLLEDALWKASKASNDHRAPSPSSPLPRRRLSVRLDRFEAVEGGSAVVEASWSARALPQGASISCRARLSVPLSGSGPESVAAALSSASLQTAAKVGASLKAMSRSGADPCSPAP